MIKWLPLLERNRSNMILKVGKNTVVTRFFGSFLKGSNISRRSNFNFPARSYSIQEALRLSESRLFQQAAASNTHKVLKYFYSSEKSPRLLDRITFDNVCSETLESLTEYFEELIETVPNLRNADAHYNDGVLTVNLGDSQGTYVINKQGSNFQIWLSSPKSGPKRYDYVDGAWVYRHDKSTLHSLLDHEIGEVASEEVHFREKCLHAKTLAQEKNIS